MSRPCANVLKIHRCCFGFYGAPPTEKNRFRNLRQCRALIPTCAMYDLAYRCMCVRSTCKHGGCRLHACTLHTQPHSMRTCEPSTGTAAPIPREKKGRKMDKNHANPSLATAHSRAASPRCICMHRLSATTGSSPLWYA